MNACRYTVHFNLLYNKLINNLWGWNDHLTLVLAREKSLLDYVYDYWQKFMKHLNESPEGNEYRET
jgi:hypothetical protein